MNKHIQEHYRDGIALHDQEDETFEGAKQHAPDLPKGWFELSRLPREDRIEFVKGYWKAKLPFAPHFAEFLETFFAHLDDVGIYLTPHVPEMVYSLENEGGFFRGGPPASSEQIAALEAEFDFCQFPEDYLAFLYIHDGFAKVNDTGTVPTDAMPIAYTEFQELLLGKDPLEYADHEGVNPKHLLPFYQSFGLSSFQCFYADWYPQQEMGNLYYSGLEHRVSDYRQPVGSGENLAFPTYLEWLLFYLETVDVHS